MSPLTSFIKLWQVYTSAIPSAEAKSLQLPTIPGGAEHCTTINTTVVFVVVVDVNVIVVDVAVVEVEVCVVDSDVILEVVLLTVVDVVVPVVVVVMQNTDRTFCVVAVVTNCNPPEPQTLMSHIPADASKLMVSPPKTFISPSQRNKSTPCLAVPSWLQFELYPDVSLH